MPVPDVCIAYISEGKLYYLRPDRGEPVEVVSRFAQEMVDRDERRRQKDEWKRGSTGWAATSLPSGGDMLGIGAALGVDPDNPEARPINIVSVCAASRGKLIYALETDAIGGLFEYDPANDEEKRLVHRAEFRVADLDVHPGDGKLACCLHTADGSVNLATMRSDGGRLQEITEGDSLDQAPSWVEGQPNRMVYQSAGIARDQQGSLMDISPYRVESLDIETGEHEVLFASDEYDCMMPRMTADDSIYYIRRPYKPLHERTQLSPWQVAKDVMLFPIRLAWAVVAFLNVFSLMFTKKPLITANGPRRRGPTGRQLYLYGRLIEAQQAKKNANANDPVKVPDDWELVCSLPNGKEQILATGVGHYALLPHGHGVAVTDGSAVRLIRDGQPPQTLAKARIIERLATLGDVAEA